MRLMIAVSLVDVLLVSSLSLAQSAAGPSTFENLIGADASPAHRPVAVDAATPTAWRLEGAISRPPQHMQHPDLDKAWVEYTTAVTKVADDIRQAIEETFDKVAAKGDLAAAERWQTAKESFEKNGTLPISSDARSLVTGSKAACRQAKDDLEKAYDKVIKALTMEKQIADAKAVWDEREHLFDNDNPPNLIARLRKHRYRKIIITPAGQRQQSNETFDFTEQGEVAVNGKASSLRWEQSGPDSIRIEIGRPHGFVELRLKTDDSLEGHNKGRSDNAVWRWELLP